MVVEAGLEPSSAEMAARGRAPMMRPVLQEGVVAVPLLLGLEVEPKPLVLELRVLFVAS